VHKRVSLLVLACALASCASRPAKPDNGLICRTYTQQASQQDVVAHGTVAAIMARDGDHESYLLKLDGDCDLLLRVDTNASTAVHAGEQVVVKGAYEYDPDGGVLHGT
jgi:Protein of unknown function (DUF3465)